MSDKEIQQFRTLCARYEKNKKILKFYVRVEKKGVKLNFEVLECPPEFQNSAEDLVREMISKGIQFVSSKLVFSVSAADQNQHMINMENKLHEILVPLLNYLLKYGFEPFNLQVRNHVAVYKMEYELSHLRFIDGNWVRWTGAIWNGKSWTGEKSSSSAATDPIAETLSAFLESQFIVN